MSCCNGKCHPIHSRTVIVTALNTSVNGVCMRQDALAAQVQRFTGDTSTFTNPNRTINTRMSRIAKIEFPKFYGDNPTGWVYICNQFFKVDDIEEGDKVKLASMHLFSSTYEDPMSELKNIRQKWGLVQLYIDAFDVIMTKVEIPEAQAVSFFLGGLDKEIEMTVRMFKPQSCDDVYCLSKLQERNNSVSRKITKSLLPTLKLVYNKFARNPSSQCRLFSLEILAGNGEVEEEMDQQIDEGVFGYEDSAVENLIDENNECNIEPNAVTQPQISLNAISGVNTFQTIRVKGQINNKHVNILIYCGSTHNFLDVSTIKKIGCPVKESYSLQVTVEEISLQVIRHARD
ncbi:hypothetical protein Tco_1039842 [Tanacetum coccineum]